jgi:hypothetical protein
MDEQERQRRNTLFEQMFEDYEWVLDTTRHQPLRWKGTQRSLCEWAHHVSFDGTRHPFNKATGRLFTYTRVLKDLCQALGCPQVHKPTNVYYQCCLRKNQDWSFLACYGRLLAARSYLRPIMAYLRVPEKEEGKRVA